MGKVTAECEEGGQACLACTRGWRVIHVADYVALFFAGVSFQVWHAQVHTAAAPAADMSSAAVTTNDPQWSVGQPAAPDDSQT